MNLPFYVLQKGEENAGNIFIKILITETNSKVFSQVNDLNGGLACRTGALREIWILKGIFCTSC